jgi:glycerol-3-phosphate dehydrogenase
MINDLKSKSIPSYDVVIIGAGIVGSIIARELSRYQAKVLLLEKANDVSMGATKANSGIVHGGYDDKHGSVKAMLSYKGRLQFEHYESELHFGFRKTGSLVIGFNEQDRSTLQDIFANGKKNGVHDISLIEREQILAMEPHINPDVLCALYCEGAGVCSPYEFAIALAENAIHNGVEMKLNSEVIQIDKAGDHDYVIHYEKPDHSNYQLHTRYVINAAGCYSDKIARMVGADTFSIIPRKGEYLLFDRGTGSLVNNVIFQVPSQMGKGILVTSTYHGNLMIGPDAQNNVDKSDVSTKAENLYALLQKAQITCPELPLNKFIRSFAGLRAVSDNNDFIIEESTQKGFINVAGIQSPGLTASPAIAQKVIEILQQSGLSLIKQANFDPNRGGIIPKNKPQWSSKEINTMTQLPDNDDQRIICRCEQVTQATILDALERGIEIHSTDAIKRRTRAGMGFCQGQYCRSRVKELVEKVQQHSVDDIPDTHEQQRVNRKDFLDKYANKN